ncbi:MAG: amino acid dehydrogenase [Alteromonadaceae bacterium]|uniref:D-amino acid dehydrogenase n=1 Tax=unclassified Marinobacter TaxID=83889 RepID=UPI000C6528F3|nr:D-amino acid dehydrogenase [Marinobacter sp. BGYM27]MAA66993.1 amino acid dehydrogenase [Alteromonadaceae bacterium]MBH83968.1 amino acid dehydrogenase [Alteromonadaceae bacterium]MDG5499445.1 D-amino acid dehydrogenase [Marinobacter sp. BGYM27]|tara:strand:- start:8469 stop:9722 length:1254 start_codon:yes stop_codon:yes gene_type:complete
MHILVLGAGVVGTTTAWFLKQAGHDVTVIERQSRAALETSYANGGQVSVSHAEPWANPSAPLKVLKWLNQPEAPLLFHLRMDPAQWLWGLSFLRECTPERTRYNIRQMVNIGTYSRAKLQALRKETGLHYDQLEKGILHFYTDQKEFDGALEPTRIMCELGCQREVISTEKAIELEPALAPARHRIVGATYTAEDESGDACKFTQELAAKAEAAGVTFLYNTEVVGIERNASEITGVHTVNNGAHTTLRADSYVLSLGSYSPIVAKPLGIGLRIYPAKGYSITVPVKDEAAAFKVSLTDDQYKLVYSRLGDRLRVAGTAELTGYSRDLNIKRCQAIVRRSAELMPEGGHWDQASFWTGLRPTTPSNVPYVGRTRYRNLFLNTGHGTLGWTHSCGSAAGLTDIISGRKPEVDFAFTGL